MDAVLQTKVRTWFNEKVQLSGCDNDLKRRLLRAKDDYPRLDGFLTNMCIEIDKADRLCAQRGIKLKTSTMQTTVYDMTDFFIKLIEGENARLYESAIDKAARNAKAEAVAQAEDFLAGGTDNEFSEAGLVNESEVKIKELKD